MIPTTIYQHIHSFVININKKLGYVIFLNSVYEYRKFCWEEDKWRAVGLYNFSTNGI